MTTPELTDQINALPPAMRDRIVERLEGATEEERTRLLERAARMISSMTPEQREQLLEAQKFMAGRNAQAPEVGDPAPDFELALLDGDGATVRLSDLRGKPAGLIFGSYT